MNSVLLCDSNVEIQYNRRIIILHYVIKLKDLIFFREIIFFELIHKNILYI